MARRTVGNFLATIVVTALTISVAAVITAAPSYAVDPVAGGLQSSPPDTLTPNQGNSGYDVSHYDINFSADFTTALANGAVGSSTINATTTVTADTTGAPLSSYSFDFQGSTGNLAAASLNVDTVTVDGVPATFSRIESSSTTSALVDNHKLIVTPATPVSGTFTTAVTYHGAPVIHFDTDGSAEGWNNTTDGATFVNQPVGSMTLFPNNNTPRDKATYTFTIDVPTMLKTSNYASAGGKPYPSAVASNGELISKTPNGDGTRTTWVWNQTKQMASELSMVSIGRYDVYESDITLASGRTIHEWSFIDPAIAVSSQNTTQVSRSQFKALLDFYESKYGPYPGNSTGVVTDTVPSTINYALETQDRPFFPTSAGGSFYHEIMHQWWGDNVSPWDWNDITLNEGPATYAPFQFGYESAGTTSTTTEQSLYNSWNTTSGTSSTFTVPSAAMTAVSQLFGSQVYQRGAMSLEALRTAIGAADFETLMRQYQLTYGGGQITGRRTQAFEDMAESISGRDLTAFFQAWWYVAGKPAWQVKFNLNLAGPTGVLSAGSAASYTLSIKNTGKIAMPSPGTTITLDASDILDDAALGTLPGGVTQAGNTLSWVVPATALAGTASTTIPFTVNPVEGNGKLVGVARAATLGGTCLDCTAINTLGRSPISPAVTAISGGTPTVGAPLTADTSGWAAGTSFAYQWFIDGTPVPGATNATYTPTFDAFGLPITVQVNGKQAGLNPTSATSPPSANVVRATQMAGTQPTISGTPKIGSRLVLDRGTWEPGTVFTYQWRANGTNISAANGGTGPMFTPNAASQVGQTIDVVVTGTKAGYTTLTKTSAATAAVVAGDPLTLTPTPVLTGTPKVGVSYIASPGAWDDGVALTYQWQANGVNIASSGTAVAFTPTATQLGQTLTITVTGTKPGIPPVSKTSLLSAPVDPGTQTLQPTPSITGTPRAGTSSATGALTWDSGTAQTRKWYVDGVEIPGATATSYTPTIAQIGQTLTYEVTSTRAGYTTVVKTSPGKVILGLAQTLQPTPTISGAPKIPNTLTGDPGTWDAGTTLSYQWFADAAPIGGATNLTYDLTADELGMAITFAVTSTKPTFETVAKTSAATSAVAIGDLVLTPTPTISGTPKVAVQLTAEPGTWDAGVSFGYQWTVDGTDVAGATDPTYTPVAGDAGKVVTVKVTGSKPGFTSVTKESAATAAVADGDQVLTPTPTITGTPKVAVQLTAVPGAWDAGVTFTYQWTVDGTNVGGATDPTYTPVVADAGKVVTVKVTGTKAGFSSVTKESAATAAVADGDQVLTPNPTITGTAKVAVQLTAVPGTWDAGVTFTYQWTVDGTNVAGATNPTYTPVAGDAGKIVTVKVTGTKTGYTTVTKQSAATSAVANGDQVLTPKPTVTGTAKVGEVLTAHTGTWDAGVALTYQWTVDGTPLMTATSDTYAPVPGDIGKVVTVKVTGTKAGYTTVTKESDATTAVLIGTQTATPTPTITGTPKVAVLLTAVPGSWDGGVTLSYQWTVDGANVPSATGSSYAPVAGDAGKVVTVKVTGTKAGYTTVTRESAPTAAVANGTQGSTPTPTISGTPKVAVPLTVNSGLWDDGAVLTYQWTAGGTNVAGATNVTYTPVAGDVGKVITVKVTGTRPGYDPVTKESAATAAVALGDLTTTPVPAFSGTSPKVGITFTAIPGTWDSAVTFAYQWTADGSDIPGATSVTYTVVPGDLGKVIAVKVTGSKTGYNSVTRTSPASAVIQLGDLTATPKPTVTGTPKVGLPLTANAVNWDAGVVLSYQWTVNGFDVSGATSSTYTPVTGDVGKVATVKVTHTKTGYTTVTKESAATSPVVAGDLTLTPTPTISGTAKVGQSLTATAGTWDAGVVLTYQWTAAGIDVGDDTASYTPRPADVGNVITVKVTGTKAGFDPVVKESAATPAVVKGDLALTPTPTISGTPQFGATLTANAGTWDAGTSLSYEWMVEGAPPVVSSSSSYAVRASDVGKTITVAVTGAKPGYNPATRTSAATGPVAAGSLADGQCTVDLKGKAKVGKTLTARITNCPAGAVIRYAWYAGKKVVKGADGATLKLKAKYAGKKMSVLVTVTLPGYNAVARTGKTGSVKNTR